MHVAGALQNDVNAPLGKQRPFVCRRLRLNDERWSMLSRFPDFARSRRCKPGHNHVKEESRRKQPKTAAGNRWTRPAEVRPAPARGREMPAHRFAPLRRTCDNVLRLVVPVCVCVCGCGRGPVFGSFSGRFAAIRTVSPLSCSLAVTVFFLTILFFRYCVLSSPSLNECSRLRGKTDLFSQGRKKSPATTVRDEAD